MEKTPSLCYTIPAFSGLIGQWEELSDENPAWRDIIQPGLDKLSQYEQKLNSSPAYVLAMGEATFNSFTFPT